MLTVKYRDNFGNESIHPDVKHVSFHDSAVTCDLAAGGTVTFGPMFPGHEGVSPVVFVMNEAGATVGKYDLYPISQEAADAILSTVPKAA